MIIGDKKCARRVLSRRDVGVLGLAEDLAVCITQVIREAGWEQILLGEIVGAGVQPATAASCNTCRTANVQLNGGNGTEVAGSGNTVHDNGRVDQNTLTRHSRLGRP